MRENTRPYTTALLCALVASMFGAKAATAQRRQTDRFVRTIERLKRSIVPVVCVDETNADGMKSLSIEGTGVFVERDGTFVTPDHVLRLALGSRAKPCPTTAVYVPVGGWRWVKNFEPKYLNFVIGDCIRDPSQDLAVCKPVTPVKELIGTDVEPVVLETSAPPDGTAVVFTGFPNGTWVPISSRGVSAGYTDVDEHGPRTLVIDKHVWPGSSGSPVYTDNGRVVGIVLSRGDPDHDGMAFARTSARVQQLLDLARTSKPAP